MSGKAEAVTELYALMPDAFTAARNQRASEAVKAGDKNLGKAIRALPKPSSAAWLVNMLTLHRPELVSEVLELGAVLREAQSDLDQKQLRQLSGERQRLLRSAAREAGSLAEELGHRVSTAVGAEVEQTLWAAMTDADAAAAAASGQLVRALEANGWDPVDVEGAVADPDWCVRLHREGGSGAGPPRIQPMQAGLEHSRTRPGNMPDPPLRRGRKRPPRPGRCAPHGQHCRMSSGTPKRRRTRSRPPSTRWIPLRTGAMNSLTKSMSCASGSGTWNVSWPPSTAVPAPWNGNGMLPAGPPVQPAARWKRHRPSSKASARSPVPKTALHNSATSIITIQKTIDWPSPGP